MASNLLSIVYQESQTIDEEKLRFICTKRNIWDHKMSREKSDSFSDDEKMQMLRRFYSDLVPVYYSNGKKIFVCYKNCVFLDNGQKQDCVKYKINVIHCNCSSDDEIF